ncbi:MAG: DJ-1/PfpI family protein, partial [Salinivenus sp.]
LTALDLVGAYDPITRLHSMGFRDDFEWDLCAFRTPVHDGRGLRFTPDRVGEALGDYDLLVVPGGHGTDSLQDDEAFLEWLQTAAPVGLKASVCTGSLLLGAAGFLTGHSATTHPNAREELRPYCAQVVNDRVVDDGAVVTARGVSAGIDLGLHLVDRLAGPSVQAQVAEQMDYPYGLPAA